MENILREGTGGKIPNIILNNKAFILLKDLTIAQVIKGINLEKHKGKPSVFLYTANLVSDSRMEFKYDPKEESFEEFRKEKLLQIEYCLNKNNEIEYL